jgi:hypothetical protein
MERRRGAGLVFDDHRSITLRAKANLGPTHTAIVSYVLDRG